MEHVSVSMPSHLHSCLSSLAQTPSELENSNQPVSSHSNPAYPYEHCRKVKDERRQQSRPPAKTITNLRPHPSSTYVLVPRKRKRCPPPDKTIMWVDGRKNVISEGSSHNLYIQLKQPEVIFGPVHVGTAKRSSHSLSMCTGTFVHTLNQVHNHHWHVDVHY